MTFPRYPAYRPSGVEWLGEIPAHWSIEPVKQRFEVVGGSTPASDRVDFWDGEIPWATPTDLSGTVTDVTRVQATLRTITPDGLASCSTTMVPAGSLIMSTRAPIGSIGVALVPLCTNQGCKSLVARVEADALYFGRVLYVCRSALTVRGKGTTFLELSSDELSRFPLVMPPFTEQKSITAFLDRETTKLDALIAEQQRLIELLKEKRQAVISHAVTKGLDPGVPMKDSGIEWLGRVPKHWSVKKLKYVVPGITVGIVIEPSKYYVDDGVPALRSLNVAPGRIRLENLVHISVEGHAANQKSQLRAGDLVAVRSGQPGTTAVVPEELDGCNCIDLIIIRRPTQGSERYLSWQLASDAARVQFSMGAGGAIQQHFNVGAATNLVVTVPPVDEQHAIADWLEAFLTTQDALIADSDRAIALLRERRTALITAAVTGQIDVRGLAATEAA